MKHLLVGLALVAGFPVLGAPWTSHGPYGGSVTSLVVDDLQPSTVYAGTYSGGVFKSTDFGDSWFPASAGLRSRDVRALVMDPKTSKTLYVGTASSSVFKSVDGAATWLVTAPELATTGWLGKLPVPILALTVDPADPSIVLAGTDRGGTFRSTDSGGTWARLAAPSELDKVMSLAVSESAGRSTVLAGTERGLRLSTDAGASWVSAPGWPSGAWAVVLAVDPSDASIVYAGGSIGVLRSTDAGYSWRLLGSPTAPHEVTALEVNPRTPGIIYAGTGYEGVYRSTNGGDTWTVLDRKLIVQALALNPEVPSTLFGGQSVEGIAKSTDSGMTWKVSNRGLTNVSIQWLQAQPAVPTTLFAGTSKGLCRSTDSGESWSRVGLAGTVSGLGFDPASSSTLLAATGSGVYRSTDSGESWSQVSGPPPRSLGEVVFDPVAPGTIYGGANPDLVLRSTDSGLTWLESVTGMGCIEVWALAIDPLRTSTLFAGGHGHWSGTAALEASSTDSGVTWSPPASGLEARDVNVLSVDPIDSTVYAGTFYGGKGGGVYKSTDSGITWMSVSVGLWDRRVFAIAFGPSSSSTLFVGTQDGLFRSTNGAATWAPVTAGLSFPRVSSIAVDSGATTVHVGTVDGSVWSGSPSAFGDGDLNEDGVLDVRDAVVMASFLAGNISAGTPPFSAILQSADLDHSGLPDVLDLQLLVFRIVNADTRL